MNVHEPHEPGEQPGTRATAADIDMYTVNTNASAGTSRLPVPALSRDVRPIDAVYDAELVDDSPGQKNVRSALGRFTGWWLSWWLRLPLVPAWLKSRRHARQAVKDLAASLVRAPFRFVGAVARGLVAGCRWWRRWVSVRDFREAAESAEKLADKFAEIRALTLFRWKVTGAVVTGTAAGLAVTDLVYGSAVLWIASAAASVALALLGRRKDGSPGRKAVLAGPRTLTWTMDPQVLVDAFRDAKLIGKDETLRLVERATRTGQGWAITVDLPATRKATDVIKNREALASALAVDEVQLIVERVRGNGGHAGRVSMWVADSDPYATPPRRTPAAGVVVVLATQRPDAKTIPSGLRAVVGSRFALRVMDWRDSNIVLGEQMNTRGYDSSRLLASHKGVGILRPDGQTQAEAEVLALTVRTDYMPNQDWQTICQRGRALREAEGTLTGHAAGEHLDNPTPELDHLAAVRAIGAGTTRPSRSDGVSEPLAAIIDHLDELSERPEFIATAELAEVLDFDPAWLGRRLAELGCQSTRERVLSEDGRTRQIRGYLTTDLLATATTLRNGEAAESSDGQP